ncbi:hypothetical protein [Desulfatirhabdium butyrativorans]|uniref:hypothetical protein n=1 Tax=Desulfatirhabdium butyrativorans TaxID=340467 RepID=UPI000411B415|nr:hypothetical protein [Desulfatirhabdium butyrativorans]
MTTGSWLQNRLSPVKRDTARWQALAQAVETFWQENFDDLADRLDSFKSIFTVQKSDQLAILAELGKYYDIDLPDDGIPIAVIQRRMELFQKDSLIPLTESLKRACPGIHTEWLPLYTFDMEQYGASFYTERELRRLGWWPIPNVHYLDGSWKIFANTDICLTNDSIPGSTVPYMTSRAKILIDESGITNSPEQIESTIRARVSLVKPLHIVLHGIIWSVTLEIDVENGDTTTHQVLRSRNVLPVFCCYLKVDGSWILDGTTYLCANNGDLKYQYPVSAGLMTIRVEESIECMLLPELYAQYLDGSLSLDGTWSLDPYPS